MKHRKTPMVIVYLLVFLVAFTVINAFEELEDEDGDFVSDADDLCPGTGQGHTVSYTTGCSCEQLMEQACAGGHCCSQPAQGCEEFETTSGVTVPRCCALADCGANGEPVILPTNNTQNQQVEEEQVCVGYSGATPDPAPLGDLVLLGACCPQPTIVSPGEVFTGDSVQFAFGCIEVQYGNYVVPEFSDIPSEVYGVPEPSQDEPVFNQEEIQFTHCSDRDFPAIMMDQTIDDDDDAYNQGYVWYNTLDDPTDRLVLDHCASATEVVEYGCDDMGDGDPDTWEVTSEIVDCDGMCSYATGECERPGDNWYHYWYLPNERCASGDECEAHGFPQGTTCHPQKGICEGACQSDNDCTWPETCDESGTRRCG